MDIAIKDTFANVFFSQDATYNAISAENCLLAKNADLQAGRPGGG